MSFSHGVSCLPWTLPYLRLWQRSYPQWRQGRQSLWPKCHGCHVTSAVPKWYTCELVWGGLLGRKDDMVTMADDYLCFWLWNVESMYLMNQQYLFKVPMHLFQSPPSHQTDCSNICDHEELSTSVHQLSSWCTLVGNSAIGNKLSILSCKDSNLLTPAPRRSTGWKRWLKHSQMLRASSLCLRPCWHGSKA